MYSWQFFIQIYAAVGLLYVGVVAGYVGWRVWPRK